MNNWMVAPIMWEYGNGAKCYSAKLASLRSTNIAAYMADSKQNLASQQGKEQKQATRHRMGNKLPILPIIFFHPC